MSNPPALRVTFNAGRCFNLRRYINFDSLEKVLIRTVAGFGEAIRRVSWQEVQAVLQPGEAAIEFVRYKYYNPAPTDSAMYAALLLRRGETRPHFIHLFEERDLEKTTSLRNPDCRIVKPRF